MDNYYNSIKLAHTLLIKGTYCIGTLRANIKGNPKEINSKKLKVGESVGKFTKESVCVMKWSDRREVKIFFDYFKSIIIIYDYILCVISSYLKIKNYLEIAYFYKLLKTGAYGLCQHIVYTRELYQLNV